ncbi:hypothetical protein ACWEKJ_30390 [Amycolatopsis thermoflava]|uniref:hypothetical protein n=1 Tax=Amycolatopsis sp. NPDC006125 TaxID=3156730 RepID=UPI0033A0B9FC
MSTGIGGALRARFSAAIMLGIGDDDAVDCVVEQDFRTEQEARRWIEQTLPVARMPEWVYRRPHGAAGAFLFAIYREGFRVHDDDGGSHWEEYPNDAPERTADLVDGVVIWWPGA